MELADPSTAPFYIVPHERVVSIEHPCIVRNFDNGIKSLGGEPQMKHVSGDVDL
jgi:general transcription factor 3C polypeptide 5 (transcription factor C subunit 1)